MGQRGGRSRWPKGPVNAVSEVAWSWAGSGKAHRLPGTLLTPSRRIEPGGLDLRPPGTPVRPEPGDEEPGPLAVQAPSQDEGIPLHLGPTAVDQRHDHAPGGGVTESVIRVGEHLPQDGQVVVVAQVVRQLVRRLPPALGGSGPDG